MILVSHPTGNEFSREAIRALNDAGLLSEFWTSVSWNERHPLNRVLPRSVSSELGRRSFSHIGRNQLHCHPWVEVGRLTAQKLNLPRVLRHETGIFCVDAVYQSLDARVAARLCETDGVRGVYAYEDGALSTFRVARQLGIKAIYELPIGYWKRYRELMREEAILQPDWAVTLQGRGDSDEKLRRKDEELALATHIVVPSDFVSETLQSAGPLEARITVLPYGAPPLQRVAPKERCPGSGRLKVLFVGGLSQRKGVSYLVDAVSKLGSQVEFTLIGKRVAECPALDAALQRHRWIPTLPHPAILEEMSRHDVMVLPSLFEGCALVVLESMSQGVPVIATPNTGGTHFISDGEDGFIVPIRDTEAIVEKLVLLMGDRDRLAALGRAAKRKAEQHSWKYYRERFAAIVRQAIAAEAPIQFPPAPSHFEARA